MLGVNETLASLAVSQQTAKRWQKAAERFGVDYAAATRCRVLQAAPTKPVGVWIGVASPSGITAQNIN